LMDKLWLGGNKVHFMILRRYISQTMQIFAYYFSKIIYYLRIRTFDHLSF